MKTASLGKFRSARIQARLARARVARLATVDARGRPHLVPICFVATRYALFSAIDRKPKQKPPEGLARVRNIARNPRVALLVDHYEERWDRLWFILVRGRASLLRPGRSAEYRRARALLRRKYRQYARGLLAEDALLIRIRPDQVIEWGPR
jgi:PPOX class probable F420-dependent enzyme